MFKFLFITVLILITVLLSAFTFIISELLDLTDKTRNRLLILVCMCAFIIGIFGGIEAKKVERTTYNITIYNQDGVITYDKVTKVEKTKGKLTFMQDGNEIIIYTEDTIVMEESE